MRTKTNRFLSIFMILTMLASLLTSLTMTASAAEVTASPGGTLFYETFTGYSTEDSNLYGDNTSDYYNLPTYQPTGTTDAYAYRKKVGTVSEPGYGTVAEQNGNTSTTVQFSFPAAYNVMQTDTNLVAEQGPNAKLTLEFDFKFDSESPTDGSTLHGIVLGDSTAKYRSSKAMIGGLAGVNFIAPNIVRVFRKLSSYDDFTLPEGTKFEDWNHYTLTMNLTDADKAGMKTFSFLINGKNLTNDAGKDTAKITWQDKAKNSPTEISKVSLATATSYVCSLDNVSLYKVNEDNPALSIAGLVSAVNTAYTNMTNYDYATNGAGTPELTAFNTAYNEALALVTTAFGTYDANGVELTAAKTQAEVDIAIASLTTAETALKEVLPPYYVAGHTTHETTGALTGVTVEALKDFTPNSAKLIVATYDTEGMVEAFIQDFTGAEEITFDPSIDITNKLVKVFIWEFNNSSLLHLAPVYTFGEAVPQD